MERISQVQYLTALQGSMRALVALCALIIFLLCSRRSNSYVPAFKYLKSFAIVMGLWGFTSAAFFIYPETNLLPAIRPLIYATIAFGGPAFLFFSFAYTLPHRLHWMKRLHLLLIFPGIVTILLLVPPLQKYIIIFTDELIYIPYRDILELYQPLYYVHIIYAYLAVLAGIALLIRKTIRSPKDSSTGNKLAILAATLFILQHGFSSFGEKDSLFFWVPSISVILCMLLLFFTLYYDHSEQVIFKGQSALLENIPFPILFLNNKFVVIYTNEHGKAIYNQAKDKSHQLVYRSDVLQQYSLFESTLTYQQEISRQFIQRKDNGQLFLLQEQPIDGERHKGQMMMIIPLTSFQNFFSALEDKAFRDSLCNCHNRHYLEYKQKEILVQDRLPLSVLMCDLDNLKSINDLLGHHKGDEYIRMCHDEIRASIRKDDLIFRIGGDEFLVLLQRAPAMVAQNIAKKIEDRVFLHKEFKPHKIGISVGTATITHLDKNLEECIQEADKAMYARKQRHKQEAI